MYPQSMIYSKRENIIIFHLKMNIFTALKYCCILHGRVCVMCSPSNLKDDDENVTHSF